MSRFRELAAKIEDNRCSKNPLSSLALDHELTNHYHKKEISFGEYIILIGELDKR